MDTGFEHWADIVRNLFRKLYVFGLNSEVYQNNDTGMCGDLIRKLNFLWA